MCPRRSDLASRRVTVVGMEHDAPTTHAAATDSAQDDQHATNAFLDAALSYAALGWPVLPLHAPFGTSCTCRRRDCRSVGKHPRTRRGSRDASRDVTRIHHWGFADQQGNIGIATGAVTGLVVLDIDPRHGGIATLERLEWGLGSLPHTVEAVTGSLGAHLLFRAPDSDRIRGRLGPGVDVKFNGGYIVAPPSRHFSGRSYSWARGRSPFELPVAPLPRAWHDALTREARFTAEHVRSESLPSVGREQRARAYVRRLPRAISGQHGHDATFLAALVVVRGFELEEGLAFRILAEDFNPRCEPPWAPEELRRKIEQVNASARAERGFLLRAHERSR
jgi:hypothetical protein